MQLLENIIINFNNFCNLNGFHAYNILKAYERYSKQPEACRFFIISNPHGKNSNLSGSKIELKKIEEILQNKFGLENKDKYKDILKINEKYEKTGKIYMPLEYYKDWSCFTAVCYPHYSCFSYICNIQNELDCLYIYEISINEEQLFTCQVCFQSFRALRVNLELYHNCCGIKIINNDKNLNKFEKYNSYEIYNSYENDNDNDSISIKEIKKL